jgi:amino acid transporter
MADLVDSGLPERAAEAPAPSGEAAGARTLRRNTLSMPEVLAQSVANMAPTAAMALLPLLVFLSAGNGTWLSFVIATVLMVCVGYCASQFARRMNSAGSFYVWVTRGLGSGTGHTAGWALQLGYICTGMATVLGFGIFGGDLLSRFGLPGDSRGIQAILYVVDFLLPVAVAIRDVRLSTRTSLTLESVSIAIILILCVAIWIHRGGIGDADQFGLKGVGAGGVFVGVVLAIFAFVGFESAGSLGLEARDPYRMIGRAILYSALLVGIFYVVVSYSQVYGFQGTKPGFAGSQAPLPDLSSIVGLGALAPIIDLGIMASMFACTLACINAAARMAFTMAHDGMGVSSLTRTHSDHRTPHVAMWVVAVPMALVPLILVLAGRSPVEVTGWAGTVATFGFMLAYALVSIAAPVFLNRIGETSPLVAVIGIIGALVMVFVFWANWLPQFIPGGLFPSLAGILAWLPYVFFAWVAAGLVWYAVVRSSRPHVARQVGTRYETAGGGDGK